MPGPWARPVRLRRENGHKEAFALGYNGHVTERGRRDRPGPPVFLVETREE